MEGKLLGKDVNLYMMQKLDDESLFSFCLTNKNMAELCNNEDFWRIRFTEKYGSEAAKYKPPQRKWKHHYLKMIVDLNTFSGNPWSFFMGINWMIDTPVESIMYRTGYLRDLVIDVTKTEDPKYETYHNAYWLLNLGDEVNIVFRLFRSKFITKTYRTMKSLENEKGYFSPDDILKIVYNFYQEDVTDKEYELNYAQHFPVKRKKRIEYLFPARRFKYFLSILNSGTIERVVHIK